MEGHSHNSAHVTQIVGKIRLTLVHGRIIPGTSPFT
jgi:hypothetical protein